MNFPVRPMNRPFKVVKSVATGLYAWSSPILCIVPLLSRKAIPSMSFSLVMSLIPITSLSKVIVFVAATYSHVLEPRRYSFWTVKNGLDKVKTNLIALKFEPYEGGFPN